jgi:hypothetical protein
MTYDPIDTSGADNSADGTVEVGDLEVTGQTLNMRTIESVATTSDLPAVDPPQLIYVQDIDTYKVSSSATGQFEDFLVG